ncbi:nucleotidyltransferase domain-containing protein [Skermanella aerolata]
MAACQRFHVRLLALFGSTRRRTARPESDIQLLV